VSGTSPSALIVAAESNKPSPTDDPLSNLDVGQLADCARLLAVSIAHHRAKFGVVPISSTSAETKRSPLSAAGIGLQQAREQTLVEALDVLRREAHTQTSLAPIQAESMDVCSAIDKRHQLRISIAAPIEIRALDSGQIWKATLHNISWGGAALRCDERLVAVGTRIALLLPAAGKRRIDIEAQVQRDSLVDGKHEYGVRFDSLDPDDEEHLLEVLTILMASPDVEQRRSEVRLVQRLEIEYGDAGEFCATLEDISTNGMMLTVPDPIEIGDSLLVSLSSADTPFALNLRARVMHQTLIEGNDIDMYRVGLQFEHPSERLRERITSVLQELAVVRPRDTSD
jgi:c-di-GMP-binding flagellar brake protein YcgR